MRLVLAVVVLAGVTSAQAPSPRERAVSAASGLAEILKQLLAEELKKGGFEGAVAACSESAQAVTEEYAREIGLEMRRVSLQYRNRKDQPDEWESARLRAWASATTPPKEVFETVTENGKPFLRYLKPIVIQPMCLSCHGAPQQIPPAVQAVLNERYPRDKATGYKTGDLRGAFSVSLPIVESGR